MCVEGKKVSEMEACFETLLLPNERGFVDLKVSRRKVYVRRELLAEFKISDAGVETYDSTLYESRRGYIVHWAEFNSDDVWVEVGKNVIINRKYQGNKLMLNLRAGFYVGYGDREMPKFRLLWPWEVDNSADNSMGEAGGVENTHAKRELSNYTDFLSRLGEQDRKGAAVYLRIFGDSKEARRLIKGVIKRRDKLGAGQIPLEKVLFRAKELSKANVDFYCIAGREFVRFSKPLDHMCELYELVNGRLIKTGIFSDSLELYHFEDELFIVEKKFDDNGGESFIIWLKGRDGKLRRVFSGNNKFINLYSHENRIVVIFQDNSSRDTPFVVCEGSKDRLIFEYKFEVPRCRAFNFSGDSVITAVGNVIVDKTIDGDLKEITFGEKSLLFVCKYDEGYLIQTFSSCEDKKIFLFRQGEATLEIDSPGFMQRARVVGDKIFLNGITDSHVNAFFEMGLDYKLKESSAKEFFLLDGEAGCFSFSNMNKIDRETSFYKIGTPLPVLMVFFLEKEGGSRFSDFAFLEERRDIYRCAAIPAHIPTKKAWFSSNDERETYENRRHEMLCRIVAGDYSKGVQNLELFGYFPAKAVESLGDELVLKIEGRLSTRIGEAFRFQEAYLSFIEKLWYASYGEIEGDLFRRVVSRWDILVNVLAGDIEELERILEYFDEKGIYMYLYNGKELPDDPEVKGFVHLLTREDLKVREANLPATVREIPKRGGWTGIVERHDLAFYYWAGLYDPGWSQEREKHARLLADWTRGYYKGDRIDHKVFKSYVRSEVKGQDLKRDICGREFIQNGIDAGAKKMDILTSTQRIGRDLYHFATYRDDGRGLSDSGVKELLLNLGVSDKRGGGLEGKKNIGKNGIGFESALNDNDVVVVKSSSGDGNYVEVELRGNNLDAQVSKYINGLTDAGVSGFEVSVGKKIGSVFDEEENKIKIAFREMALEFRVRDMAGLVDPAVLNISYKGVGIAERILNKESLALKGRGVYSLLKVEKEHEDRVVQNGLIVNHSKERYLKYFPEFLKRYVEDCAFEIGENEELTRGRDDVMEDERVVANIFIQLAMQKAIKEYLQTGEEFGNLPKDYLYSQHVELGNGNLEGNIPMEVKTLAEIMNGGDINLVDLTGYQGREEELTMLMTLIGIKDSDGKIISLQDVRDSVARGALLESSLISSSFRMIMTSATRRRREFLEAYQAENEREDVAYLPTHLEKFQAMMLEIYQAMGLHDPKVVFYSNPKEIRIATFGPNVFKFRREAIEDDAKELNKILALRQEGLLAKLAMRGEDLVIRDLAYRADTAIKMLSSLIEGTGIHEEVHEHFVRLGIPEGWSHGKRFKDRAIGFVDVMLKNGYNPLIPQ